MSYRLKVRREALRDLKALPGHVRAEARRLIRALRDDPYPARAKELRDKPNIFRIWLAARWRLVYEVDDQDGVIHVLRIRLKDAIDYEGFSSVVHEPVTPYGYY